MRNNSENTNLERLSLYVKLASPIAVLDALKYPKIARPITEEQQQEAAEYFADLKQRLEGPAQDVREGKVYTTKGNDEMSSLATELSVLGSRMRDTYGRENVEPGKLSKVTLVKTLLDLEELRREMVDKEIRLGENPVALELNNHDLFKGIADELNEYPKHPDVEREIEAEVSKAIADHEQSIPNWDAKPKSLIGRIRDKFEQRDKSGQRDKGKHQTLDRGNKRTGLFGKIIRSSRRQEQPTRDSQEER